MQQSEKQHLKEVRTHGTSIFPCAFYLSLGNTNTARLRVKHHWHEELEIIYLKSGKFRVSIDMESFDINQECFFFVRPGQVHSILALTHQYEEQALVFDPQMLRFRTYDSIDEHILQPVSQGKLTFPQYLMDSHPAFPALRAEFERISGAFFRNQEISSDEQLYPSDMVAKLQIKASLLHVIAFLTDQELMCHTDSQDSQRIDSLKTVLAYISSHYREKLYIQDLASLVNMNEQYFCRFFKNAIGKPPIDYINDFRLNKVIQLLETTELPVTEIGLECGFNNMGNFQRLFKRKTGTTPLQYRKQLVLKKSDNPSEDSCPARC